MIARQKDPTKPDHDPGDEADWSYNDSALLDAVEWRKFGPPAWKVELMQNLARRIVEKE